VPSSFSGSFSRVDSVAVDDVLHSGQANQVAKRINQGILSGLGDMHWRCLWAAHSFVRNLRNPSNDVVPLYPPEDEWWQLYGLYKETVYNWPTAGVGDYEGLNQGNPAVGFFFGNPGKNDSEHTRTEDIPLREFLGAPAPSTPLEEWDLGKQQRGAILASDLTDFSKAPAMEVARIFESINSGITPKNAYHKTLGGKIQDSSDEMIHEKGQQWNQMMTQFLNEWRGTDDEREDAGDWNPKELTVAYEEMLDSQWFLAPAYGVSVGSGGAVSAEYPLFEWATPSLPGTYGSIGNNDNVSNPGDDFSFYGFLVVGVNVTTFHRVEFEIDGVVVHTTLINAAKPQDFVMFPVGFKGNLKVKLVDGFSSPVDIYVEVAQLMDHKPEVFDLYVYLRMATARSSSPSIYRGKIVSDAKDISDDYFSKGMILNGPSADLPAETNLAKFAPYQAMRDFLISFFRIVNYDRLKGYYVDGDGNSVLVFDRRGKGDSNADIFQNLAPLATPVTQIQEGVLYIVKADGAAPSGDINYDGSNYKIDETFRGNQAQDLDFTGATDLGVYESDFLIDIDDIPKTWISNEWVMSIGGQTVYKDNISATYKPDTYGDILGAFHDRCHTFSSAMDKTDGTGKGKDFHEFGLSQTTLPDVVTKVETPPGYRYEGDDVPYSTTSRLVNDLIDTADGASSSTCRDSIWDAFGDHSIDDVGSGDCDGISAHYESCQVFKAPYLVKAIRVQTGAGSSVHNVEVVINGRLTKSSSAPSSIADSSASRSAYLSTDTGPRTDENTVVACLRWKIDGVDDEERIGDISATADADYDPTLVKGAALCRFFFQRLAPHVYDDADIEIQPDRDTKPIAQLWQYHEFVIRASVSGFLDEQRVLDTLTYDAGPPSLCWNQDSRDLTMAEALSLIGSSDDRLAIRNSGEDRGGYGVLPNTIMRAAAQAEMAQVLNLLTASRFGVPVYLESRTLTWSRFKEVSITNSEGFSIIENLSWEEPGGAATQGAWGQDSIPFSESAEAWSDILSDGGTLKAYFFRRSVEWRVRPHPKVIEAVPLALRSYVDSVGLGTPILIQDPIKSQVSKLKDPSPGDDIDDVGEIVVIENPAERCMIGQSGTLEAGTPPNGPIIGVTADIDASNGAQLRNSVISSIGINSIAENYIRVPLT
jgi:hypothetical protein